MKTILLVLLVAVLLVGCAGQQPSKPLTIPGTVHHAHRAEMFIYEKQLQPGEFFKLP